MTGTRYQRASEIFLALLDLPPGERRQALDDHPGLEASLRDAVLELLEHHADDDFLERGPAVADIVTGGAPSPTPERIGGYRVLRRIGSGGMGTVYEVSQDSLGRRAALKVIHGVVDDAQTRLRFQLEIDVLARLQHPGIARIYDAGIDGPGSAARPFFVMELIDGQAVDAWVAERGLDIDETLEVFLGICDAVEHAHQRGVIHRDLKPANILVDSAGQPRILDFGIARPTDKNLSLAPVSGEAGSVIGTLECMSPEQCSLGESVDVRSDVYSLGVLLYRLITGGVPLDVTDLSVIQAARKVCEQPPRAPVREGRRLSADLEAILLHTLEKQPGRRYASVSSLADDLRRYLRGLPISARPPSRWRRVTGWAARHPVATAAVGSVGVAVLALASASALVWWLGIQPHRIENIPASYEADLISRAGNSLHTWHGVVGERRSQILDRDDTLGGGRVAILEHPGRIAAYDVSDPQTELWSTGMFDHTPPGPLPSDAGDVYVEQCLVGDFLPERPGDEIFVAERLRPHSPAVLRVIDAAGVVAYEVWHEGSIIGAAWLPASQRLLCAGYLSGQTWAERGIDSAPQVWPVVVFALRLDDGHSALGDYIVSGDHVDPTVEWYRWVGPLQNLTSFHRFAPSMKYASVTDAPSSDTGQPPSRLMAQFFISTIGDGGEYVNFYLDGAGREFTRFPSDEYKVARSRGDVPDPGSWRLIDLSELPARMSPEPSR